jgi:hypothetical protein
VTKLNKVIIVTKRQCSFADESSARDVHNMEKRSSDEHFAYQACPRSLSAIIWISSITATSNSRLRLTISIVADTCVAPGTSRFSWPVDKLVITPFRLRFSYTSRASKRSGPAYRPPPLVGSDSAKRCKAW